MSFFIFLLQNTFSLQGAKIIGQVTDVTGEPLSFASVYLKNTSIGTTTNIDGYYTLELQAGSYDIVFQYVGYQQSVKKVTIKKTDTEIKLDIQLKVQSVDLGEIVVHVQMRKTLLMLSLEKPSKNASIIETK